MKALICVFVLLKYKSLLILAMFFTSWKWSVMLYLYIKQSSCLQNLLTVLQNLVAELSTLPWPCVWQWVHNATNGMKWNSTITLVLWWSWELICFNRFHSLSFDNNACQIWSVFLFPFSFSTHSVLLYFSDVVIHSLGDPTRMTYFWLVLYDWGIFGEAIWVGLLDGILWYGRNHYTVY